MKFHNVCNGYLTVDAFGGSFRNETALGQVPTRLHRFSANCSAVLNMANGANGVHAPRGGISERGDSSEAPTASVHPTAVRNAAVGAKILIPQRCLVDWWSCLAKCFDGGSMRS